jgi:hypothetical protein
MSSPGTHTTKEIIINAHTALQNTAIDSIKILPPPRFFSQGVKDYDVQDL